MANRWIALLLIFSFCFCTLPVAAADAVQIGVVSVDSTLNVRTGPGTSYQWIDSLSNGVSVYILESVQSDAGETWYKIEYGDARTGYVHSDYVGIITSAEPDADFEQMLDKEGFPESYKDRLRLLHAMYPAWIFKAQHLPMDWETALTEESEPERNMVYTGSDDSWKSIHPDVYDHSTGTWKGLDGNDWVGASREIIAYYMDPRNFLSSESIFLFLAQSYDPEHHTPEGTQMIVEDTFLDAPFPEDKTLTYTDVLIDAAEASGVSPYILASMILVEQGIQGQGNSISGKVDGFEGLYNYLNIGAYASGGLDAVEHGLWWANGGDSGNTSYGRPWNTRYKSIIGSAKYYGNNYVNVGQDTLYLKKFDLIDGDNGYYDHQYMTNVQGAVTEASQLKRGYADVMDAPLVFNIPVFAGMPDEFTTKPTGNGSVEPRLLAEDIAELPKIGDLTADDAKQVFALVDRYNAFSDAQKMFVTNYADLLAAERQIRILTGEIIPEYILGDADLDGSVAVGDLMKIKACIMADDFLPDVLRSCDLDGDGTLTVADIIAVKQIIMTGGVAEQ